MKNNCKPDKACSYPKEWLYLSERELGIREIADMFDEKMRELWEDAEVLEIALAGGYSIDFEIGDISRADEETMLYFKQKKILSVFLVTIVPENFGETKEIMGRITETLGGFFCGDTPDFTPVVK